MLELQRLWGAFGYQLTNDLGKYLGIALHHNRLSRRSFSWATDKLMSQLSSRKANSFSVVRKLTLCNLVVGSLPSYTMQSVVFPTIVCEDFNKVEQIFL